MPVPRLIPGNELLKSGLDIDPKSVYYFAQHEFNQDPSSHITSTNSSVRTGIANPDDGMVPGKPSPVFNTGLWIVELMEDGDSYYIGTVSRADAVQLITDWTTP